MEVQKAGSVHLPGMKALFTEFVAYHAILDDSFAKVKGSEELFGEYVRSLIGREDAAVFVALKDGAVIGHIIGIIQHKPPVYLHPAYGYIDNTAVQESVQRQGTGAALYHALRKWFAEHDIKRIELCAALANPKSTAFWRKMGLEPFMETLSAVLQTEEAIL